MVAVQSLSSPLSQRSTRPAHLLLSFPPFQLDLKEQRLRKEGVEVHLARKPFAILRYLVDHPRQLVTHEEVVEAVWGRVTMSESVLRSHIHALRQVLGAALVETVVGRGYRFMADVQEFDASSRASVTVAGPTMAEARPASPAGRSAEPDALQAPPRDGRQEVLPELQLARLREHVALVRTLADHVDHFAQAGSVDGLSEQLMEEAAQLGCRLFEAAAAMTKAPRTEASGVFGRRTS